MFKPRRNIPIELSLAVLDKKGSVLDEKAVLGFHRPFFWCLAAMLSPNAPNHTNPGIPDITGNSATNMGVSQLAKFSTYLSGATILDEGIVVGTGTSAVDRTDNVCETPIAIGTGAGQLVYGTMTSGTPVGDIFGLITGGAYVDIKRDFTNSSGADITIEEVCWYARIPSSAGSDTVYMFDRSLFNKTILDTETLTFRYRLQGA